MFPPVPCSGDNDLFISYFYHGALIQLFIKTYSLRRLFIVANLFFLIGLAIDVYSPSFSILLLADSSKGLALGLLCH